MLLCGAFFCWSKIDYICIWGPFSSKQLTITLKFEVRNESCCALFCKLICVCFIFRFTVKLIISVLLIQFFYDNFQYFWSSFWVVFDLDILGIPKIANNVCNKTFYHNFCSTLYTILHTKRSCATSYYSSHTLFPSIYITQPKISTLFVGIRWLF